MPYFMLSFLQRARHVVFGVLVLALVVGTTIPGDMKAGIEGQMWSGIPWSALAHYSLFALIAICPVYGAGWKGRLRAIAIAAVLAITTEVLQNWVPGRHPTVRDTLIDLAGSVTGLVIVALLASRVRPFFSPGPAQ